MAARGSLAVASHVGHELNASLSYWKFAHSRWSPRPLTGIKILDLTRVLAGPFCTQILADYGADVIKVEHPVGGVSSPRFSSSSDAHVICFTLQDDTGSWRTEGENQMWKGRTGLSAYFSTINRNKKSITLNLKHEKARQILFELAKDADVVVNNFVPGKTDELGIGYKKLRQVNPGLIHASVSGYGAGGPYAKRAGYDVIAAAEGGLLHITGDRDGRPTKPGVGLTDMCTGLYLHGAILAALVNRQATGNGQKIDASLFETKISLLANVAMSWLNIGLEAQRWGTEHPSIVPYDSFQTADSVLVLGATNNRQFGRTKEWLAVFEGSGMPYGPTIARNMIETLDHDATASGQIKMLGIPVKFSETKPSIRSKPPALGEHSEEVLRNIGLSIDEIQKLREEKVI
ncbi:CoA-transferase family III [Thozetella sp. PMI_491]|nr:CoA-transferase family III [Thozetella sp. PMI_491]